MGHFCKLVCSDRILGHDAAIKPPRLCGPSRLKFYCPWWISKILLAWICSHPPAMLKSFSQTPLQTPAGLDPLISHMEPFDSSLHVSTYKHDGSTQGLPLTLELQRTGSSPNTLLTSLTIILDNQRTGSYSTRPTRLAMIPKYA